VPAKRDIDAFDERAAGYDHGRMGQLHHAISDRTAALAATLVPAPRRVLDIGCGTGYLLGSLAGRYPDASELAGVDPAPSMIEVATRACADERIRYYPGVAEDLTFADDSFDLVTTTTSFDHWSDQLAGLRQCARVLTPGGRLVLVDQFSPWLVPTLIGGRRKKARTRGRANGLLVEAGFMDIAWSRLYAVIINAVTATTPPNGA
jgi:ubiquinone/menaquinone biosynthesis C-methylase UbiE